MTQENLLIQIKSFASRNKVPLNNLFKSDIYINLINLLQKEDWQYCASSEPFTDHVETIPTWLERHGMDGLCETLAQNIHATLAKAFTQEQPLSELLTIDTNKMSNDKNACYIEFIQQAHNNNYENAFSLLLDALSMLSYMQNYGDRNFFEDLENQREEALETETKTINLLCAFIQESASKVCCKQRNLNQFHSMPANSTMN